MTSFPLPSSSTNLHPNWLRYGRDVGQAFVQGFRSHAVLYAIAFLSYAVGLLESLWLGLPVRFGLVSLVSGNAVVFLAIAALLWGICHFFMLWKSGYRGSLRTAFAAKYTTDIAAPTRIANIIHALLVYGIFFVGFLAVKKAIPHAMGGFPWDTTFMELDRTLHGGRLPHEWLLPLLGGDKTLFTINFIYNFWTIVTMLCWFRFGFTIHDSVLRQRYLMACLLAWFCGTMVLGTVLASAGPCYFALVSTGANPYASLMQHLRAVNDTYPIWALPTQEMLWANHIAGFGTVEGISAMPSLHVGQSVLFILLALAWGKRWFKLFAIPFAATIFVGSVLLAWHYAADGYLGAAIAIGCWWLAGKLSRWQIAKNEVLNSHPSSTQQ
jgi:hypothetical protein